MISLNDNSVLVLIQLFGGNDGLNTIIPIESYDILMKHRGNIMIPEKKILKIDNNIGLHPSLCELRNLYDNDELLIINDVGYPTQNRSHFKSLDIWTTGSNFNKTLSTGWLGRSLDLKHPNYPNNYPNEKFKDPIAISIGSAVADVCQGIMTNYSHVLNTLNSFPQFLKEPLDKQSDNRMNMLKFINTSIDSTNSYNKRLESIVKKGISFADYPENNELAQGLKKVVTLLSGGSTTRIFHLSLSGFDTHAYQTDKENQEKGTHAFLLKQLSEAISIFHKDLKNIGHHKRVLTATYSEFGRQIKSNNSFGTDHGDAAPMFLFGHGLTNSMIGKLPKIENYLDDQAAVPLQFDFRDVFASIINKTMSLSPTEIESVFNKEIASIPLF